MALARPRITPQLPGLPQVRPQARPVPAFASPRGGGAATSEVVDFSEVSRSLTRFLLPQARARGQQERARGQAFVKDNPELVERIEAQAEAISGPKGIADFTAAFQHLIDTGEVPEAASPLFQIGFVEQRARQQANQVRSDLIQRLPELTNVTEDEDPPNIDQVLAEAFAEAAGSPSARSLYGQPAFNGQRTQIEEEIRRRYDEGRSAGIQAQHRTLFRDSVGAALSQVAAVSDEEVGGSLVRLADVLEDEGKLRNIRDVRGVFLEALELETSNIARDDVEKAVWLARMARHVPVSGKPLGEEGSFSAGQIDSLIHDLNRQREEKGLRENQLVTSNQSRGLQTVRGIAGSRFFDALRDPARTVEGELSTIISELDQNEDLLELLGRSPGEGLGAFKGLATNALRQLATGYLNNSGQDDPELVGELQKQIRLGLSDDQILTQARELFAGDNMSTETYDQTLADLETNAPVRRLTTRQGSEYRGLQNRLDESLILSGFSASTQVGLLNAREDASNALYDLVARAVGEAGEAPAAQEAAFRAAVRSPEALEITRKWQEQVVAASTAYSGTLRKINGALANFNADEATSLILTAADEGGLNADQVPALLADVDKNRGELDAILNRSPFLTDVVSEVRTAVTLSRRAAKETDESKINDAARAASDRARDRWKALARASDLSPGSRADSLAAASRTAIDEAIEPFREAGVRIVTAAEEAEQVGLVNEANRFAAQRVRGANATESISTFFEPLQLIDEVAPGLYGLVDDIEDDPFFSTREENEQEILSRWDFAALSSPKARQADVYASLHGQHFIPYQAVLGGNVTLSKNDVRAGDVEDLIDVSELGTSSRLSDRQLEQIRQRVADNVVVMAKPIGIGFHEINVVASIKLDADVLLSPYGTQYFATIGRFDKLDEASQTRFLKRLGFNVEGDRLIESKTLFRDDQVQVIADWDRRKGVE